MTPFDRRSFVAGLAASGVAVTALADAADGSAATPPRAVARSAGAGAGAGTAALEDPAALYRNYRRIRFADHEEVFFWWLQGRRFGFVDQLMTPFFTMNAGSMHRCRNLGDGRYEVATASALYFTDLASGELLEDWANPVTGKTVRFSYPAPARAVIVYSDTSGALTEPVVPGARVERRHVVAPLQVLGPDAWLTEESYLHVHREAEGTSMRVQDMYTFSSPVAALRDARLRFVPAIQQFNDYNDWSPRFQMGDRPGSSVSRCSGRKVAALEDMPQAWLRIARRLHPEALRDPARTLG